MKPRSKSQMFLDVISSAREKLMKKEGEEDEQEPNYLELRDQYQEKEKNLLNEEEKQRLDPSLIKMRYYPKFDDQEKMTQIVEKPQQKNYRVDKSQKGKKKVHINSDYDIWDLTYTFISIKINVLLIGFIFFVLLIIRYFTIACLIYIAIESSVHFDWIIVVIIARILYFILVVKISLKTPQSKTQIVLKSHWNSKESDVSEIFEVIDSNLLLISILRGVIPAELSFFYIKASQAKRQFQIYSAINYIYASIEAIVYYPFFIVYVEYLRQDERFQLSLEYDRLTIILAGSAFGLTILFSLVLLMIGIQKKYGKIFFCCQ